MILLKSLILIFMDSYFFVFNVFKQLSTLLRKYRWMKKFEMTLKVVVWFIIILI